MPPDVVEIILALRQLRQFVSGTDTASKAIKGVGTAADKSGKQAKVGWKGIAKWAGGAAAVYGVTRYVKGAVGATEDLAKTTLTLNRTTGMGVKGASAWAAVLQTRNIQTKTFQMGLVKLSRSITQANDGNKTAVGLFKQVGISQKELSKLSTDQVIFRISDAFKTMHDPARRAALTQQFFSRSGQQLLPVLASGSKGIREQLGMAQKYGATLGTKTVGQVKEMIAHEREMKFAFQGVKVQLGTALMPVLLAFSGVLIKLLRLIQPLTKHSWLLQAAIIAITIAFLAWKVVVIAATIADMALNVQLLITVGIIAGVILVVAALAIGFVILYKKVGWFRAAVDATWKWIKKNWPLLLGILLGPFWLAVVLIVKNFGKIKAAAHSAISFITGAFNTVKGAVMAVVHAIETLIDKLKLIPSLVKKIPGAGLVGKGLGALGGAGGRVAGIFGGQAGGVVPRRSPVLVGERGPELLSLPAGAAVTPLPQPALAAAAVGGPQTIITRVYLDRRQIAEAVGSYTADRVARR